MTERQLHITLNTYWHAGTGQGASSHLDTRCARDPDDLPLLPGRQLKGLLRQAMHLASVWGWLDDVPCPPGPAADLEALLFGSADQEDTRHGTLPGCLIVGSAGLPAPERAYLAQPGQQALGATLFDSLHQTAINERGSAKRYSLRGMEVCLPVTLTARLQLDITSVAPDHRAQQQALPSPVAWEVLQRILPLLQSLGASRSRGLGEIGEITLSPVTGDDHETA